VRSDAILDLVKRGGVAPGQFCSRLQNWETAVALDAYLEPAFSAARVAGETRVEVGAVVSALVNEAVLRVEGARCVKAPHPTVIDFPFAC
jgi:hypothetical protein